MTKEEIIKAAYQVWGREFYSHTSLSKLAAELGVRKPALYRHFISKNALMDAMTRHFFNDFTAFIKRDYDKALESEDKSGSIFSLIRVITEYYARNSDTFIYSMIQLHEHKMEKSNLSDELRKRGVDFKNFHQSINKEYNFDSLIMRLLFSTLTFYVAGFHKMGKGQANHPDEGAISEICGIIGAIIGNGLGYINTEISSFDYDGLEKRIAGTADNITDDPLLKAVAGAVAEAGPWEASMEQVARRSGLSKSSLYGHFKNRQDMLQQLFMTEFHRILDFARQGIQQSPVPLERLYLGIFSIAEYLRCKPDILVALDWIRNRKLNFNPDEKKHPGPDIESLRLFDEIDIKPLLESESPFRKILDRYMPDCGKEESIGISPWILFLIVNTLMRKSHEKFMGKLSNEDIRTLFRFITLGVNGFKVNG